MKIHRMFAGLGLLTGLAAAPAQAGDGASVTIVAKPVREGQAEVQAVAFRETIRLPKGDAHPLDLRIPITYASRGGIADRVRDVVVRDAAGVVPMTVEDEPINPGGFPFYRHWRAGRPVRGQVTVTYRMLSQTGPVTVGPQFDFYAHGGGVSSGGMALFMLPQNLGSDTDLKLRWDLSDLPRGSIAASTYGAGAIARKGTPEMLAQAYYMAGPLGRFTAPGDRGFNAYWLGRPAFEPSKEMAWTYKAYGAMKAFWKDPTAGDYTVFVRALPGAGGGTAVQNSFMTGVKPGAEDPAVDGPRGTLFHEIGHMFVGAITGGPGQAGATWFSEGLNVHYTRLLMLRANLAPIEDYLNDINISASRYHANPFRLTPAEELSRIGFSSGIGGGGAQNIAYTRGSLYFADVDAKIRAASDGGRKLDDVILPLFEQRRQKGSLSQEELLDALVAEIGPSAREAFEAVIVRGENISPASGAFGPCFERVAKTFEVKDGRVEGYEWVRVPGVADEVCRSW